MMGEGKGSTTSKPFAHSKSSVRRLRGPKDAVACREVGFEFCLGPVDDGVECLHTSYPGLSARFIHFDILPE